MNNAARLKYQRNRAAFVSRNVELKWCKSRRRLSVMGGECTGSASTRHALTTGSDTRDIDRRSLAVRAKDVMGNMTAVLEQYDKLLRRYCNNFHNKKLRHALPFIQSVWESER